jgi:hypothetical protein
MAGGIDWFRWHHGTVTDQKFPLIARRAQASVAEVIAVWACLLEAASMAAERGDPGLPDFEAMDCALGMEEGTAERIYGSMQARSMVSEGGTLPAWEKRQPKREREGDPTAAERQRNKRARDKAESHVTPDHATSRQETHRGEESRGDISPSLRSGERAPKRAAPPEMEIGPLVEAGMDADLAADFIAHKRKVKAPLTARAWKDHVREAKAAGWTVAQAAEKVLAKSWKGFEAKYVVNERPAPTTPHLVVAPTVPSRAADATADYLREQERTPEQRQAAAAAAREARERMSRLKGGMLIGGNA